MHHLIKELNLQKFITSFYMFFGIQKGLPSIILQDILQLK